MTIYGKTTRCAIAALAKLAGHYHSGELLGSQQIASSINLPQTLVAKILTIVSTNGLVIGTRGPNGGYKLAADPSEIYILQIVDLFTAENNMDNQCPMGPGWCEIKDPCPLHSTIKKLREDYTKALKSTSLAFFIRK